MAELIGGSGYGDVQNTAPTSPSIGDTWLDTSTDPPVGKLYADLGSGGQWTTDLLDAQISSRSSHSDPDPNGYIDAKVSKAGASEEVVKHDNRFVQEVSRIQVDRNMEQLSYNDYNHAIFATPDEITLGSNPPAIKFGADGKAKIAGDTGLIRDISLSGLQTSGNEEVGTAYYSDNRIFSVTQSTNGLWLTEHSSDGSKVAQSEIGGYEGGGGVYIEGDYIYNHIKKYNNGYYSTIHRTPVDNLSNSSEWKQLDQETNGKFSIASDGTIYFFGQTIEEYNSSGNFVGGYYGDTNTNWDCENGVLDKNTNTFYLQLQHDDGRTKVTLVNESDIANWETNAFDEYKYTNDPFLGDVYTLNNNRYTTLYGGNHKEYLPPYNPNSSFSKTKQLAITPSNVVLSHSTEGGIGISYTIDDGNGNTVSISESNVDSEISTSNFTGNTITVTPNLSESSSTNATEQNLKSFAAYFQ